MRWHVGQEDYNFVAVTFSLRHFFPDLLLGLQSVTRNGYREVFPRGKSDCGAKLDLPLASIKVKNV